MEPKVIFGLLAAVLAGLLIASSGLRYRVVPVGPAASHVIDNWTGRMWYCVVERCQPSG